MNQQKMSDSTNEIKGDVLDRLDWRILEALQHNARISNTELGKQIGLSQPAVTARIKKLEDRGVIEGYAAKINPGLWDTISPHWCGFARPTRKSNAACSPSRQCQR
jgi:predicted transcriptional regulator